MREARTWAACLGVLFLLTLTASSARADSFRADDMVAKLNNSEGPHLNFREEIRAGMPSLFAEFFEGNNGLHLGLIKKHAQDLEFETSAGKHFGFSVASANRGNNSDSSRDRPPPPEEVQVTAVAVPPSPIQSRQRCCCWALEWLRPERTLGSVSGNLASKSDSRLMR